MRQIHQALRHETQRVETWREAKIQAIKSALRSKIPPLSVGAKMGIQVAAELFIQNISTLHNAGVAGKGYLASIMRTFGRMLQLLTPLSICDSHSFSPDVAVGLEPVLRFLRELASYDSNEFKGEYNSEFYINKGAQKSCFQNSLPTPVFPAA
jgi:hypothetical protein